MIAGYANDVSYDGHYLVIKIDTGGSLIWENTYSDPTFEFSVAWEILEAPANDEFYVFGSAQQIGTSYADIRILRIDTDGNLLEETMFGGAYEDWVYAAAKTSDGGYIIATAEGIYPYSMDIMLIKVDSQLDIEWQKELAGKKAVQLLQNDDGTIVITGVYIHDLWLMCADSLGNQLWETFLNAGTQNHCGHALCSSQEGGYFVAANTCSEAGLTDLWLLNFESYTGINIEDPAPVGLTISSVQPNPFQSSVTLEYFLPVDGSAVVSVYDAAGRIVDSFDQSILPVGFSSFCWTPDETLPAGCYTLVLEACGETASRRCVLLR